jgi:hypothetical protein
VPVLYAAFADSIAVVGITADTVMQQAANAALILRFRCLFVMCFIRYSSFNYHIKNITKSGQALCCPQFYTLLYHISPVLSSFPLCLAENYAKISVYKFFDFCAFPRFWGFLRTKKDDTRSIVLPFAIE